MCKTVGLTVSDRRNVQSVFQRSHHFRRKNDHSIVYRHFSFVLIVVILLVALYFVIHRRRVFASKLLEILFWFCLQLIAQCCTHLTHFVVNSICLL